MKGKMVMTIYSTQKVNSFKEVINFVRHLIGGWYGDGDDAPKSLIKKFNNSCGYKKVQEDINKGVIISAEIENPEDYRTPYELITDSLRFFNQKNELVSFVVPLKRQVHTIEKYTYEPFKVMINFQNFIYKVFPDTKIQFHFEEDNYRVSIKEAVMSEVVSSLAWSSSCEPEISLPRKLKKKDVGAIINMINEVVDYEPTIVQGWCETCHEYHADRPYHLMVLDKRFEENYM